MGAGVQPLEELCGVFSSCEEDHAQETQFSPSFCGNNQLEEWETFFMTLMRIKLQEHQPLTRHQKPHRGGAGVSSAHCLGRALPSLVRE